MKNLYKTLIISFLSISTYAQQASEIDPKFVKLPRYANLSAITTAISTPTQGMMVYNIGTASNWSYNGTSWTNTAGAVAVPLNITSTSTTLYSTATGTNGNAGRFEISDAANFNDAITANTAGPGNAISAFNSSSSTPTALFSNNIPLGNAIEIQGGIRVVGNIGKKAAFKIVTSATYISANKFGIQNTTMANVATDILIVTYEYTGGSYLNKQFATFWNGGNWEIHLTDSSAMPVGITFNILVIKQ